MTLKDVDSPCGRRRVSEFLETTTFPHYLPAPGKRGMILRVEADGRRTLGRFVRRRFQPSR